MTQIPNNSLQLNSDAEVNLDVSKIAKIAVAHHEEKLEKKDAAIQAEISKCRTNIANFKKAWEEALDKLTKNLVKKVSTKSIISALDKFTGLKHKTDYQQFFTEDEDGVPRVTVKVYIFNTETEAGRVNAAFQNVHAPIPAEKQEYLDVEKSQTEMIHKLTENLSAVRRELRNINKLERRAEAKIAAHSLKNSSSKEAQALLAAMEGDLMGESSALLLKA